MTDLEKVAFVKTLVNDASVTEDMVLVYLSLAMNKILERCYPFRRENKAMPEKYELIQCELASRYIIRRGVEGQVSSSENGISRSYGSANDEDLLKEVVQIVGVR